MPTYVVTGATGHVGSAVAGALLAQGRRVRVITRDAKRADALGARGAEIVAGSLADRSFLDSALDGAAGFFALLPEDPFVPDFHGSRRRIAEAIAAAVRESDVPHVVMISSIGADIGTGNGPIQGLYHMENALRGTGTKLTALRSAFFHYNLAATIPVVREAGIYPNFAPSADAEMPMTAAADAGRAAAACLLTPPAKSETVDLVGPSYSARQIAAKLGAALGREVRVVDVPASEHIGALMQAGLPREFAEVVAEIYAAAARGLIVPRGDRLVNATTTIDETLRRLLAPEREAPATL